jgi:hypothetical protein
MTDYQNIPQNPLTNLRQQIRDHWTKYRPTMYAEMEANGTLDEAIENAAQLTEEAVTDYAAKPPEGMSPAQAFFAGWELFRNEWAFLPAEEGWDETDEDEEDPELEAHQAFLRRYAAEMSINDIWDEKTEEWITPAVWDEEKQKLIPTGYWDDAAEEWVPATWDENEGAWIHADGSLLYDEAAAERWSADDNLESDEDDGL